MQSNALKTCIREIIKDIRHVRLANNMLNALLNSFAALFSALLLYHFVFSRSLSSFYRLQPFRIPVHECYELSARVSKILLYRQSLILIVH